MVFAKITFAWIWLSSTMEFFFNIDIVSLPTGICQFFNCGFFTGQFVKTILFLILMCALIGYVLEKRMRSCTLILFLLSLLIFSIEESNGLTLRKALLTMLFLSHFIAYLVPTKDNFKRQFQLSLQVIAGGYFLSAISKIKASGFAWGLSGQNAVLQIKKSYYYVFGATGDPTVLDTMQNYIDFILGNPLLVKAALTTALFLELLAFLMVFKKKWSFSYGILLLLMHIGIWFFLQIIIVDIAIPMIIFTLNPFYLLYLLGSKSLSSLRPQNQTISSQ